jgi:hypothetical protein
MLIAAGLFGAWVKAGRPRGTRNAEAEEGLAEDGL